MIGTPLWWYTQFAINFLDFVIIYVFAHTIVRSKIKIKVTHVLFCVAYTLALAPILYFLGDYIFNIILYLCLIIIVKMVTKRSSLGDLISIFTIYIITLTILQITSGLFVFLINHQIQLLFSIYHFLDQFISTIFMLLICKKFNINYWLDIIQRNISLKLTLFLISLIFIIISFVLNFEYDALFLLFSIPMLIVLVLPILTILIKIHHYELRIISMHDLTNNFLSLGTATQGVDDAKVIKKHINRISKEFGIDLSQLNDDKLKKNLENMDSRNNSVKEFIELKKKQKGKYIEIIDNIRCSKDYEDVDLILMLKWLGTLLDNAIEASNNNPIFTDIFMDYEGLLLRVSNEYIGNNGQDIKKILEHGYSTKGEGRGVGLHLLNKEVTQLGGEIVLYEFYSQKYNCHYLEISVVFDKD